MNKTDELLFEIGDYVFENQYLYFITLSLSIFLLAYLDFGTYGSDDIVVEMIAAYMLVSSIVSLIQFYKRKRKIKFYQNRIYRDNSVINLDLKDISEVYKVSYFYFLTLTGAKKILRLGFIARILVMVVTTIILPCFLFTYIVNLIRSKKIYFQEILVLIGKNDKNYIYIGIPLLDNLEQKKLKNYLKEKVDIDISECKTNWFIPEKG